MRLNCRPAILLAALCLACTALLSSCPKQESAADTNGAMSPAADTQAPSADSGAAAGSEGASNPVEQQQMADASGEKVPQPGPDTTKDEQNAPAVEMNPEDLYKAGNCTMCHGADQNGSPLGPPLRHLKDNWTVDNMILYFKDPATYSDNDPRLKENKSKYSVPMPPVRLADDRLRKLAEWLMEK